MKPFFEICSKAFLPLGKAMASPVAFVAAMFGARPKCHGGPRPGLEHPKRAPIRWSGAALGCVLVLSLSACSLLGPSPEQTKGPVSTIPTAKVPDPVSAPKPVAVDPQAWDVQALGGKEWHLAVLFGEVAQGSSLPSLRWVSESEVQGSGGCNRFMGKAVVTPHEARFSQLASTRMLCMAEPSSQEDRFFKALELTARIQLRGETLQLLDRSGAEVARFIRD